MQNFYVEQIPNVLGPEDYREAQRDLNYILRTSNERLGPQEYPSSYNSIAKTVLQDLVNKTSLPKNFRIHLDNPLNPKEPPIVIIMASWSDIYDPQSQSSTYVRILGMEIYLTMDQEKLIQIWKHKVSDVVHLLWDHELHEYLKFDGVCIHDPHPKGRDGPLG